ncbi:MAG: hypothetical protein ABWY78_05905 [Microvirga sp.]
MADDVPGSRKPKEEAARGPIPQIPRRPTGPGVRVPANPRAMGRPVIRPVRPAGLLGHVERIGAWTGGPVRARSIFLQPEPDRLNRLALVVALASALTGLTLLVSVAPH